MQHILFARVGYMQYYKGVAVEKPINGGGHNESNIGHEAFNFSCENDGFCYGYVQPPRGNTDNNNPHLNIGRINPLFRKQDYIENVLVIWVATKPKNLGGGQYVVGWYKNATVYREFKKLDKNINRYPLKNFHYNIKCKSDDVVLLPVNKRNLYIPRPNKNISSIGKANIFYLLDPKGFKRNNLAKEMKKAIELTKIYAGVNIKTNEDCFQDVHAQCSYEADPKIRKAIEFYAMAKCMSYYKSIGYDCENVSLRESFDVIAKRGKKVLKIEVKGTRGPGDKIIMTKNEVNLAKRNKTFLFLVCNIIYNYKTGKTSGGEKRILKWNFSRSSLIALSYSYQVQ